MLASYAQAGQHWTFYEIDAAIERIARDPRFFSYLRDSRADAVDIVLGDARQRLQGAPQGAYRLIVLDAFSSDAVPVHLLSREAIRLYRTKLGDGGLLLFNLSNRYLDLDPVMGRQADDANLVCRVRYDLHVSDDEKRAGKQASIWAVMGATEHDLGDMATDSRWQRPRLRRDSTVWTDDYSDLASYLLLTPGRFWSRDRERAVERELISEGGWIRAFLMLGRHAKLPAFPFKTAISDQGLVHLKGLSRLRFLWLGGPAIGNAGMEAHLAGLTRLDDLNLSNTSVGDAGLNASPAANQSQDSVFCRSRLTVNSRLHWRITDPGHPGFEPSI